ncbi:MAG: Wzz/FepE/Etk N-terminal domain-containing protein, partial [Pirellulales bacterium]
MSELASEGHLEETEGQTTHVVHAALRFAKVVWRRRIYLFAAMAAALMLGMFYYGTADRVYQASASVLVMQTGADVMNPNLSPDISRNGLIPTYERLFASDVVLNGALRLLAKMPPEARSDLVRVPQQRHVEVLRRNLTASGVRNTNVIEISYRSSSPEAAAAIVSAVVESYLEFMARNHKNLSVEILTILENEHRQIDEKFRLKERELASARSRVGDLGLREDTREVHPTIARALNVNRKLMEVQTERLQLEASLAAIAETSRRGGDLQQHLMAMEPYLGQDVLRSAMGINPADQRLVPELESKLLDAKAKRDTLLAHYGENHPKVQELKQQIANTQQYLVSFQANAARRFANVDREQMVAQLQRLVGEKLIGARSYEQELATRYQELEREAIDLNDRLTEVTLLESDLNRLSQLRETLLSRMANIDFRQDQADVRITVVSDPKVDHRPVAPKLPLVLFLSLVLGCGSGAGIIYVLDLLDDRFRSPEEIRAQLDTQVLAVIRPLPPTDALGAAAVQVFSNPSAVESEAFRTLRTTLAFSGYERDRLLITSAEPSDGKTTVVTNLAASFAQAGKRTLLIDADMRKPGLSKMFSLRGTAGLSDLLRSDEPIAPLAEER